MNQNRQLDALNALGAIEGIKNDIRMIKDDLDGAPLWRPAKVLTRQCDEGLMLIANLEERLDRKLVVTLIGPCGAGKSTLLNALAGVDDLMDIGNRRPTTRRIFVLSRERADAAQLADKLAEGTVSIRASRSAEMLEHTVLVDTPDTDSTESRDHIPLVREVIGLSDVLVCIFDAENPKRKDQADFLAPYVRRFNGDSVLVVLNKCDRLDEDELKSLILPEFQEYIEIAWGRPVDRVLCVSARSHLQDPQWSASAPPRHRLDQFETLRQTVLGGFGQSGHAVDRRVKNAETLRDYLQGEIAAEVAKDRQALSNAAAAIAAMEKEALEKAAAALRQTDDRQPVGVNVLVYQRLAQQWLGPVGWLVAIWARILIFGTGIAALMRFGSPLRQVWGMVSTLRHARDSREAVAGSTREARVADALRAFHNSVARQWPDIAESLVAARFDPSVRQEAQVVPDEDDLNRGLAALWTDALYGTIDRSAGRLSGLLLQLIFNGPAIAVIGYAGWLTGKNFLMGNYLSGDFFLHAFLTIAAVLFLSFFLLQGCVRLAAGANRLTARAFQEMTNAIEQISPLSASPVVAQIRSILEASKGGQ